MPRRTRSNPRYCHFRPRNLAYVKICGKRIYLGPFNSPESRAEYDRVIAQWLAVLNTTTFGTFGREYSPLGSQLVITMPRRQLAC
jgi:hypothetical protein